MPTQGLANSDIMLQAYLASSSEDEPEAAGDAAALRDRYRALLLSNNGGSEARTGGPKGNTWGQNAASESDQDSEQGDDASGEQQQVIGLTWHHAVGLRRGPAHC